MILEQTFLVVYLLALIGIIFDTLCLSLGSQFAPFATLTITVIGPARLRQSKQPLSSSFLASFCW